MAEKIKEELQEEDFHDRFFVSLDADKYVIAMMLAFDPETAENYEKAGETEVSKEIYESIGPDSMLIDGKVVQGSPRPYPLSKEAVIAIKSARLSTAATQISILGYAVDAGIATEEEKEMLKKWQKYSVLVNRIDPKKAPDVTWPDVPE